MGWREREYHHEGDSYGAPWPEFLPPSATLGLITAHLTGFFVVLMVNAGVGVREARWFPMTADAPPIAILLHPFANRSFTTVAGVLLALYWLGRRLEPRMGSRAMLIFYLAGNLAAGVIYFALSHIWPSVAHMPMTAPVGGLACLAAIAWRRLAGEVTPVFGAWAPAPRFVAFWVAVLIAWNLISAQGNPVAWLAATMGGGMVGVGPGLRFGRPRINLPRLRSVRRARPIEPDDQDIDDILAKISRDGIDSLTEHEKSRLEEARRARLRRSR